MTTNKHPLNFTGLAELAEQFPDEAWRMIPIYVRKDGEGAFVKIGRMLTVPEHVVDLMTDPDQKLETE